MVIVNSISRELLEHLAQAAQVSQSQKAPERNGAGSRLKFDLADFLSRHSSLEAQPAKPYRGGFKSLVKCPFDPGHQGTSAAVFQTASGRPGFRCQHDSCKDKQWRDVLLLLEPDTHRPYGFRAEEDGIWFDSGDLDQPPVHVCGPLEILACTRDSKSESWGRLLVWHDADGHRHEWSLPMSSLAGDGTVYREILHDGGLYIAPGRRSRELLSVYIQNSLPPERIQCIGRIGWTTDCNYVLPDMTIGTTHS